MRRIMAISSLCLLALAGCDRPSAGLLRQMQDIRAGVGKPGENQEFSFTNFWSFSMRRDSITPRFERARTACLSDNALHCKLVSSDINISSGSAYSFSSASLEVLLPHDRIDGFRKSILAPVGKEAPGEVTTQSSSTRAENVEGESADAGRKVAQLSSYRDRLTALSKRPNLSIEDIIRLEAEISRVQGDLDSATKDKADADGRIARESVHISLSERAEGEIAGVLNRASDTFVQSVAAALEFLIRVIPWLPIIAAAILLATWLVRLLWRRKRSGE